MYDTISLTKNIQQEDINTEDWVHKIRHGEIIQSSKQVFVGENEYKHNPHIYLSYDYYFKSLLVSFSAPVLLFGTNIRVLDAENRRVVNKLVRLLQQTIDEYLFIDEDIRDFSVSRLDICKNIITNDSTKHLIDQFAINSIHKIDRKNKFVYNTGISFQNDTETILLYDKMENDKVKGYVIPEEFEDLNILRIENQIKSKDGLNAIKRFNKHLTFREIFFKKNLRQSKQILLDNFQKLFAKKSKKIDEISLAKEIIRLEGNKNYLHKLFAILLYKERILDFDTISRIIENCTLNHPDRDIRKQTNLIRLSEEIHPESCFSQVMRKITRELGVQQ